MNFSVLGNKSSIPFLSISLKLNMAEKMSSGYAEEHKPQFIALHPNWNMYPMDRIHIYSAHEGNNSNASHWRSNFAFTEPMDPLKRKKPALSLRIDPSMVAFNPPNPATTIAVDLVPYIGTNRAERTHQYTIPLISPTIIGDFIDLVAELDLFAYEPAENKKGCLWWHYGLVSSLESNNILEAGSTKNFLLWLREMREDSKTALGKDSKGVSDIESDMTVRGRFNDNVIVKDPATWL